MAATMYIVIVTICAVVSAAPPASPRLYSQAGQLPQISSLDYYLDNAELANYYNQPQHKQAFTVNQNAGQNGVPAKLETLEPDSEVELLPGAQQPQQPPQQTPVSPNIPGLMPGQRVFIVHMPVAGYRPGSIGGYQPVYIVAAAPQDNFAYHNNGYQNAILLDPYGQAIPLVPNNYARPGVAGIAPHAGNPLILGAAALNRPFDVLYQDPSQQSYLYPQATDGRQIPFYQHHNLQSQPTQTINSARSVESGAPNNAEPKNGESVENVDNKETSGEPKANARPVLPQVLPRNKA